MFVTDITISAVTDIRKAMMSFLKKLFFNSESLFSVAAIG